ncbi:MAG: hypothetical protein ACFCBW_11015 [Candidatus Competibacterales bacterium]
MTPKALWAGAANLLGNCGGFGAGDELLIVHEDPVHGWYDAQIATAVAGEARRLGLAVSVMGAPPTSQALAPWEAEAIHRAPHVVFLARLGDENRFETSDGRGGVGKRIMCYARDAAALASSFGRVHHRAMVDFKAAVDAILGSAGHIRITCPLGTDIGGAPPALTATADGDVVVKRFPMAVPAPVAAADFTGVVAVARYLTPTGNRAYEPAVLVLDEPVFAQVAGGRIAGFVGSRGLVQRVERHYRTIADQWGIDATAVHSWHAGIHPGCSYTSPARSDPNRWSNGIFPNPRVLHFHTCGAYPPGEICWNLVDATVTVDGAALWQQGRLRPEAFPATAQCLLDWPELKALMAEPQDAIGL